MTTPNPLLDSLRAAVSAAPHDNSLRVHLAELLITHNLREEAVGHLAAVLANEPSHELATELMTRALTGSAPPPLPPNKPTGSFDWSAAESQLSEVVSPKFVDSSDERERESTTGSPDDQLMVEVSDASIRLADVGGMDEVKKRLNAAFLEPMRNPKLRKLYGKNLRGGLLLYGPPGCGKTFIAKAVAGELGAKFLAVGLDDVLDMWLGNSERNMHQVFAKARQNAPCVLFLDELDGIGQKRSRLQGGGSRNVVNQLLVELDGVANDNEGVFVLAATNTPWEVDIALRRPGRFDRTVLVLPPDEQARKSILEYHLKDRPISGINLSALARRTAGLSGADLAYLCEAAAEHALLASVESGDVRMIGMEDLLRALDDVAPTTQSWFAAARNVALYANQDGTYNDLLAYMKKHKLL